MTSVQSLLGAEVLGEELVSLGVNTVLGDHSHAAADDLARVAVAVNLAEAAHLTQLLLVGDVHNGHVAVGAESLHQLGVVLLLDGLGQEADVGTVSIDNLGALVDAALQTVVLESVLDDLLNGDGEIGDLLLRLVERGVIRDRCLYVSHVDM